MAIRFCFTAKKGLGHLRRITNIAGALRERCPDVDLALVSNAAPACLSDSESELYDDIKIVPRPEMSAHLADTGTGPIVVDTAVLPGLAAIDEPLCLILRETVAGKLPLFRLADDRPWDLILVPNPRNHWRPDPAALPARRVQATGWIYRQADMPPREKRNGSPLTVLVASGGGGSGDTWNAFRASVAALIDRLSSAELPPHEFVQVLGPRAGADAGIHGVHRTIRPGSRLNEVFAQADLIVSTAGYNSVLEMACTDVPVLLMTKPTTYDDQAARAALWGPQLGMHHRSTEESAHWVTSILNRHTRRAPVSLGACGSKAAAQYLEELQS